MLTFGRRPWTLPLAAAVLTVAIAVAVIVVQLRDDGSSASNAAPLPTACQNFARASELFAQGGSAQSLAMTGGQVFMRDAQADSRQILQALMDSCDAERSGR